MAHIDEGGRRCFDPDGKRRLVEACGKPGASVAGLAFKAGVNANQLRKWIMLERRRLMHTNFRNSTRTGPAQLVPVVEVAEPDAVTASANLPSSTAMTPVLRPREVVRGSPRPPSPSRLMARLPNGVSLELDCSGQDPALITTMIDALRSR
ncbi:transposase [Paraburkholderia sp. SIMBA_055]